MGADFLSRTKPTITKHLDHKRLALCTPELFTVRPSSQPRCSVASIEVGATVSLGENLIAEAMNGTLKLRRGNTIIGSFDNPTTADVRAIERSGGAASAVVHRVHRLSKKAEVALC
jgi:hypothetical protein